MPDAEELPTVKEVTKFFNSLGLKLGHRLHWTAISFINCDELKVLDFRSVDGRVFETQEKFGLTIETRIKSSDSKL